MAEVKAVSRIEAILNGEDITPVSRVEAILSGADVEPLSREEYFVQKRLGEGGGGSVEYVIPAQDVTFVTEQKTVKAFVSNVNIEGLDDGAKVAGKAIFNDRTMLDVGTYTQSAKKLEFEELGNIQYLNNAWSWQMPNIPAGTVMNLTVVKNF